MKKEIGLFGKNTQKIFIGFIIILICPIIIYIIHFARNKVSNDPILWGSFGDYIGGIVNPVIGIASLIVLYFLTRVMNKESAKENNRLFELQQKRLAFQEFSANLKGLFSLDTKIVSIKCFIFSPQQAIPDQTQQIIEKKFDAQESFKEYYDFYYSFKLFPVKFGHLFKYDFKSTEYVILVANTERIKSNIDQFIELSIISHNDYTFLKNLIPKEYNKSLSEFVDKLRTEIE